MMFERPKDANVFGIPLGADFPRELVLGLLEHFAGQPPEELARVHLILSTSRMKRRVTELFDERGALLLPRISLISDIDQFDIAGQFPPSIPELQRELELANLVFPLLKRDKTLAPRSEGFDLAKSLVRLMNEMHEEGVTPSTISNLDVTDQSGHWERAKAFFGIAQTYFETGFEGADDSAARQRKIMEKLVQDWAVSPPDHPIIIAGSTGSRGLTHMLMQHVARLPMGAVVLPGFDYDFAKDSWHDLDDSNISEDHPQYRFHALLGSLGLEPIDVRLWFDTAPVSVERNKLISLALRPAPVTDQWISEGNALAEIAHTATQDITLLEASNTREEALSIALRLRKAAEDGTRAALITPDRTLARQVSASLGRWGIIPDDSAGEPLHLSAFGRFLRHVLSLLQRPLSAETLITILKHPICQAGEGRGAHMLHTGKLELFIRHKGVPHPDMQTLQNWAVKCDDAELSLWITWVCNTFLNRELSGEHTLKEIIKAHIELTELIAGNTASIWSRPDGESAQELFENLLACAEVSSDMSLGDYENLLHSQMSATEVRQSETPHSGILIWGTMEARVQGVDLLILAGLNEGSWPEALPPDPWLNRKMRKRAGLRLPERKIGLSAHDFQQAACSPEVWFTRSQKSDDAQTVPSRWIIRITNLLEGLPDDTGIIALSQMRSRAHGWLERARLIDAPEGMQTPTSRPAPCPPIAVRPRKLSITEVQKLIRDPYGIYAKHVLKLRPLQPLQKLPDALLRGTVLHEVMEQFVKDAEISPQNRTRESLMTLAERVTIEAVPWPAARLMWLSRFESIVDGFIDDETRRISEVVHSNVEVPVEPAFNLGAPDFSLSGKADRLDLLKDGTLAIYDYKTGVPPKLSQRTEFDQQLPITALLAENGAFKGLAPLKVTRLAYIGLGSSDGEEVLSKEEHDPSDTLKKLRGLIAAYLDPAMGFTSRRAVEKLNYAGDYDHLARHGEWSEADTPVKEVIT